MWGCTTTGIQGRWSATSRRSVSPELLRVGCASGRCLTLARSRSLYPMTASLSCSRPMSPAGGMHTKGCSIQGRPQAVARGMHAQGYSFEALEAAHKRGACTPRAAALTAANNASKRAVRPGTQRSWRRVLRLSAPLCLSAAARKRVCATHPLPHACIYAKSGASCAPPSARTCDVCAHQHTAVDVEVP